MKQYESISQLKEAFVGGDTVFADEIVVGDQKYHYRRSSNQLFLHHFSANNKGVVVYESNDNWLMFLWGARDNSLIPYDVRTTTQVVENDVQDRVIPDKVEVHFLNLPISGSLVAKVDTGAEMCSMHADNIQLNRGQGTVTFVAPDLSPNTLTLPVADQQAVKNSDGDTSYRPVVKCSLKVKGQLLKDILINLNDRSEMTDPMLFGQNALHAGKFLVDPNIMKEAEDLLTTEFLDSLRSDKVVVPNVSSQSAQQLYEALEGVEAGRELITLLRTQVLKNLDDITY